MQIIINISVSRSIESQEEEQKEDQADLVLRLAAGGQQLPLLRSPRGHGGRPRRARSRHAGEQRSLQTVFLYSR